MRYEIRKVFRLEMAHQLLAAFSEECISTIHGHSYLLEVIIGADKLNEDGMVVDFKKVKENLKPIVDQYDHALVMPRGMPSNYLGTLKAYNKKLIVVPFNPTAELLAEHLFRLISEREPAVTSVRLHETFDGWAGYNPEGYCDE